MRSHRMTGVPFLMNEGCLNMGAKQALGGRNGVNFGSIFVCCDVPQILGGKECLLSQTLVRRLPKLCGRVVHG